MRRELAANYNTAPEPAAPVTIPPPRLVQVQQDGPRSASAMSLQTLTSPSLPPNAARITSDPRDRIVDSRDRHRLDEGKDPVRFPPSYSHASGHHSSGLYPLPTLDEGGKAAARERQAESMRVTSQYYRQTEQPSAPSDIQTPSGMPDLTTGPAQSVTNHQQSVSARTQGYLDQERRSSHHHPVPSVPPLANRSTPLQTSFASPSPIPPAANSVRVERPRVPHRPPPTRPLNGFTASMVIPPFRGSKAPSDSMPSQQPRSSGP